MSRKKKKIVKGFIHSWRAKKLDLALISNWIFAQKCPNKFWKKQNILKCHKIRKNVKVFFFYFLSQRCKSHFNLTTFFKWKIKVLLLRSFSLKYFFSTLHFNLTILDSKIQNPIFAQFFSKMIFLSIWRFKKKSSFDFHAVFHKNDFFHIYF